MVEFKRHQTVSHGKIETCLEGFYRNTKHFLNHLSKTDCFYEMVNYILPDLMIVYVGFTIENRNLCAECFTKLDPKKGKKFLLKDIDVEKDLIFLKEDDRWNSPCDECGTLINDKEMHDRVWNFPVMKGHLRRDRAEIEYALEDN